MSLFFFVFVFILKSELIPLYRYQSNNTYKYGYTLDGTNIVDGFSLETIVCYIQNVHTKHSISLCAVMNSNKLIYNLYVFVCIIHIH